MMQRFKIHKLLREPLLHFLVIGAGLFFVFNQVGDPKVGTDNRIVITQADLDRLAAIWLRRMGRPPTSQDKKLQLDHYIREQVLYREALAMGLDKDDAVVKKRMAQKLEFLFEDIATPPEPDDTKLQAYLKKYSKKFRRPARYTFSHVYLDTGKRGDKALDDAKLLLARLQQGAQKIDVSATGDALMLDHHYTDTSQPEVARLFGEQFSEKLNRIEPGQWTGPLNSPYGMHLVNVQQRTDSRLPKLAEIRDQVRREYIFYWQRDANEQFYDNLLKRYEVIVEQPLEELPENAQLETQSQKVAIQ